MTMNRAFLPLNCMLKWIKGKQDMASDRKEEEMQESFNINKLR
jgi:hypothetical protein